MCEKKCKIIVRGIIEGPNKGREFPTLLISEKMLRTMDHFASLLVI